MEEIWQLARFLWGATKPMGVTDKWRNVQRDKIGCGLQANIQWCGVGLLDHCMEGEIGEQGAD